MPISNRLSSQQMWAHKKSPNQTCIGSSRPLWATGQAETEWGHCPGAKVWHRKRVLQLQSPPWSRVHGPCNQNKQLARVSCLPPYSESGVCFGCLWKLRLLLPKIDLGFCLAHVRRWHCQMRLWASSGVAGAVLPIQQPITCITTRYPFADLPNQSPQPGIQGWA